MEDGSSKYGAEAPVGGRLAASAGDGFGSMIAADNNDPMKVFLPISDITACFWFNFADEFDVEKAHDDVDEHSSSNVAIVVFTAQDILILILFN